MRAQRSVVTGVLCCMVLVGVESALAQSQRTMRPVIRGTEYAVTSMKAPATAAAMRILDAGGNAFDAVVAGQAVLALVDPGRSTPKESKISLNLGITQVMTAARTPIATVRMTMG